MKDLHAQRTILEMRTGNVLEQPNLIFEAAQLLEMFFGHTSRCIHRDKIKLGKYQIISSCLTFSFFSILLAKTSREPWTIFRSHVDSNRQCSVLKHPLEVGLGIYGSVS